jgi:hypothetical protein
MPRVKDVTGPGITTKVAMESADLGIMRWDPDRNCIVAMFGDNFEFWKLKGEWRSPSVVLYDSNYNVIGVPDGSNRVKQLWDYPHNNPEFSTVLPTDFIKIGEWWYVHVMVTQGLANEKWTEFQRSRDLITWEHTGIKLPVDRNNGRFVMLSFDIFGDYVYIVSTGGLARNKPIIMHRCPVDRFPDPAAYEPWGWTAATSWRWGQAPTPILDGRYGELSLRNVQGNVVLEVFDAGAYRCTARTIATPTDNWYQANKVDTMLGGWDNSTHMNRLYGGYISPLSRLNETNGLKSFISQWDSDNDPYKVVLGQNTLTAKGPLLNPDTASAVPAQQQEPTVTVPTAPKEVEDMSPEELIQYLAKELSASGDQPITVNGKKVTLREAVAEIAWKSNFRLSVGDKGIQRPVAPDKDDDQYGHVLSARAEGLQNQALLIEIAKKAGIDTDKIVTRKYGG